MITILLLINDVALRPDLYSITTHNHEMLLSNVKQIGLTQKITKVAVIDEFPLRKNKVFGHVLHKSWQITELERVWEMMKQFKLIHASQINSMNNATRRQHT